MGRKEHQCTELHLFVEDRYRPEALLLDYNCLFSEGITKYMHILKAAEFPVIETEDFWSQNIKWELSFKTLDNFYILQKTLMCIMCFLFRILKYRPTERLAFNIFPW